MNRPKFKAWHKPSRHLFDVTSIDFLENTIQVDVDGKHSEKMPISEFELWPYTGHEDKNGTPIYENFVYRYELNLYFQPSNPPMYAYGVVHWDTTVFENDAFSEGEPVDEAYFTGYAFDPRLIEVIGNKYDSQDVLKQN